MCNVNPSPNSSTTIERGTTNAIVVAKTIAQPIHAHSSSSSSSSHGHVIHIFSCSQDDTHSLTIYLPHVERTCPASLFLVLLIRNSPGRCHGSRVVERVVGEAPLVRWLEDLERAHQTVVHGHHRTWKGKGGFNG